MHKVAVSNANSFFIFPSEVVRLPVKKGHPLR
jgi:hypothetical protein